ncbi:MAG: hypothetical protein O2807_01275 [bacterium]|nr:hypothetical protein [bacterium]
MTVQELLEKFPEIPEDLHGEPVLARFAGAFAEQLRIAQKPSACSTGYDPGNHFYMKLVNPMAIYRLGLMKREMVLQKLEALLDQFAADPSKLIPEDVVASEIRGPGCE